MKALTFYKPLKHISFSLPYRIGNDIIKEILIRIPAADNNAMFFL